MLFIIIIVNLSNTFVSSANCSTLLVILSSKSLYIYIYTKNNKGHKADPCGTPIKTDFQFETSQYSTTRCLLLVSHCFIQSIMPSPIPHGILIYVVIFDVALCQKLSENLSI